MSVPTGPQGGDVPGTVFVVSQLSPPATLSVSPSFAQLTGHDAHMMSIDTGAMARLVHPDDLQIAAEFATACWSGRPADAEVRIERADGAVRWIRLACSPLPVAVGEPPRIVTAMNDITERVEAASIAVEAEAIARAATESKSRFISRMSHELRTPLNAVIGFGQLLERRLQTPEDLSSVHYILKSGRHLLELINEVLDISRIESGTLSLSLEPVEVRSLVAEVTALIRPLADEAEIGLAVEGGPPGLHLVGDRQRVRQVLMNLLSNAIKYNQPGGHIWVSWSSGHGASLTVRDDGRGVPAALQERLFSPFDRLGAESTSVTGSGMGLAVSRGLVEMMRGRIGLESQPGVGSSFTVTLPVADIQGTSDVTTGETQAAGPPAGSSTLLYIEDNDPNVRVIASLLRLRPGWRLLHAGHGHLGLELAHAHRPTLVLLDLHLPDTFGLEVLAALKADPATADIPVVILSADASRNQVDRLMEAGAERFLTKPVDVREVLQILDGITAERLSRMVDA